MNLEQIIKQKINKTKTIETNNSYTINNQKQNKNINKEKNQIKTNQTNQLKTNITNYDMFLLKYSRLVDYVDMFLGPLSELSKVSDSEVINGAGLVAATIKGTIKVPFITLYLTRTKDYTALYDWIPKEVFSYLVPMGSFIDVLRSYEKITFNHYGLKPFTKLSKTNLTK